jgi:hypothetical protein
MAMICARHAFTHEAVQSFGGLYAHIMYDEAASRDGSDGSVHAVPSQWFRAAQIGTHRQNVACSASQLRKDAP